MAVSRANEVCRVVSEIRFQTLPFAVLFLWLILRVITMASPLTSGSLRSELACPYFMPVEKLDGGWPHPSRLPLGAGWRGHCTAPGHEGEFAPQNILEAFCNLGYADGCTWAPRERVCDSVRFAVTGSEDAKTNADAHTIRLLYVRERKHRPIEDGVLEFDPEQRAWLRRHSDARVQKMAECYLESWLKKRI